MKRVFATLAVMGALAGSALAADDANGSAMTQLKDGVYQFPMAHYSSLVMITDEGV